jgi:branched-chain amino acid transport system substrate-binding protein
MRRLILLLPLIFGLACKRGKVQIGVVVPTTGPYAYYGSQVLRGIEIAYEEAKRENSYAKKVELIVVDNHSSQEETKRVVERLSKNPNVLAILGPITSEMALAAAPIAGREGVPLITPTATNPEVTRLANCVFRVCYTDPLQGKVLASFAFGFLGLKKAAVLYELNNPYSEGLKRSFVRTFNDLGGDVLKTLYYIPDDPFLPQKVDTLKNLDPQVLFIPGYTSDVIKILKLLKEKQFKPVLLGGDGWHSPDLIEEGGDLFRDGFTAYISTPFSSKEPSVATRKFVEAYKEKFNVDPEAPAALGYDACKFLLEAIGRLKSLKRNELCNELLNFGSYHGATGFMEFNNQRDPVRDIFITKVTGEGFKFILRGRGEE